MTDLSQENKRLALIGHKRCSKCGLVLPVTEFHRHKPSRGGLHPRCRRCRRSGFVGAHLRRLQAEGSFEQAARYERKVEARKLAERGERRCALCLQAKDKKHFRVRSTTKNKNGVTRVQLSTECNDCRTANARAARQAENKEMAARGEKRCKGCNGTFSLSTGFYRASHGGYQAYCKHCYNRLTSKANRDADD